MHMKIEATFCRRPGEGRGLYAPQLSEEMQAFVRDSLYQSVWVPAFAGMTGMDTQANLTPMGGGDGATIAANLTPMGLRRGDG